MKKLLIVIFSLLFLIGLLFTSCKKCEQELTIETYKVEFVKHRDETQVIFKEGIVILENVQFVIFNPSYSNSEVKIIPKISNNKRIETIFWISADEYKQVKDYYKNQANNLKN